MSNVIIWQNIRRYVDMPADKYFALPGFSYSGLKNEDKASKDTFKKEETQNMAFGRLVDGILLDASAVWMGHELYPAARKVAARLRQDYGATIDRFDKQVVYTADMCYNGYTMPVKGRLDMDLRRYAVIDLKLTNSRDVHGLIAWMGYEKQVWNYGGMSEAPLRLLMVHSLPLDKTFLIKLNNEERSLFWESKIVRHGQKQ